VCHDWGHIHCGCRSGYRDTGCTCDTGAQYVHTSVNYFNGPRLSQKSFTLQEVIDTLLGILAAPIPLLSEALGLIESIIRAAIRGLLDALGITIPSIGTLPNLDSLWTGIDLLGGLFSKAQTAMSSWTANWSSMFNVNELDLPSLAGIEECSALVNIDWEAVIESGVEQWENRKSRRSLTTHQRDRASRLGRGLNRIRG